MNYEVLHINDENILQAIVFHDLKLIQIIAGKNFNINKSVWEKYESYLEKYKKQNYNVVTLISGNEDIKKIIKNIVLDKVDNIKCKAS